MNIRVGIMTAPHIEAERTERGFRLRNVRIGIGFHWDRREDQEFEGELTLLKNADGTETAVNTLDLEQYLTSVISSEMSADSPVELLKAHAVISRSWAIRAIEANRVTRGTLVSHLYEQNGHVGFDVCADDHCQRYEGLGRRNERAVAAVRATAGECLVYGEAGSGKWEVGSGKGEEEVCDARFSKCCGGVTEEFETCWEDRHVPYLESVECPYCGRVKEEVLRTVLNGYDRETHDFHDWTVRYDAAELGEIIREKTGVDYGRILDLIPLERGRSGRIYRLKIRGERREEEIGKELVIRRALSRTCLYSSWFDVEKTESGFVLRGHGWGHGVGLCQIGAAEMAAEGRTYREILAHYYPGTRLERK